MRGPGGWGVPVGGRWRHCGRGGEVGGERCVGVRGVVSGAVGGRVDRW